MSQQRVGLIGVGLMGHGIAANLLKHGHVLTVLTHPGNQPLDDLSGVLTAATPAALAAQAEIVILCVTGSPQVEDVLFGDDGLLRAMRPGTVVIDCSTAIPSSTQRVAAAVEKAGGRFLDAPMTRTPKEAAEGRLNLLVGGDDALFDACRPVLACFAENIVHTGPVGSGHRMKLLHNYVSLGFAALLAEAAACAERSDVAPDVFVEVLAKGGGGGVALERMRPFITQRDPSGLRFSIANALKDLGYYQTMAAEAGALAGIADSVSAAYAQANQALPRDAVVPQLVELWSRTAP